VLDRRTARSARPLTSGIHAKCIAVSTAGDDLIPSGDSGLVAPQLHMGSTMTTTTFDTLSSDQLIVPCGGIPAAATWVMQHESGGSTTAGHLHSQGRGDGTAGNQSSAFGAFQMIEATRKRYMGADYQSTDFSKQYSAATRYVSDRYGSWDGAESFWKAHHWY
jgi:hypothetical protein